MYNSLEDCKADKNGIMTNVLSAVNNNSQAELITIKHNDSLGVVNDSLNIDRLNTLIFPIGIKVDLFYEEEEALNLKDLRIKCTAENYTIHIKDITINVKHDNSGGGSSGGSGLDIPNYVIPTVYRNSYDVKIKNNIDLSKNVNITYTIDFGYANKTTNTLIVNLGSITGAASRLKEKIIKK